MNFFLKKVIRKFGPQKFFPSPKLGAKSPPTHYILALLYLYYRYSHFIDGGSVLTSLTRLWRRSFLMRRNINLRLRVYLPYSYIIIITVSMSALSSLRHTRAP